MQLRAVIFDLGGVVLGSPIHVFRLYEAQLGLPPGVLSEVIVRHGEAGAWSCLERGEIGMDAFFAGFDAEAARMGWNISTRDLMDGIDAHCQPRPAMVRAIRRIREAGLRTAALTNNWLSADQSGKMDLLRSEFDVFVESAREGVRKPDPRIYQLVCERLQVRADEAVYLDDIGSNLKPARRLGMTTIKVGEDPELAVTELEATLGLSLR